MVDFELSFNILSRVISELKKAKEYIRIAIFQLHRKEIFKTLIEKIDEGVQVEIITLPFISINEKIRENVVKLYREIISKGATIHFCKWHVGDPGRTTTAVGVWYSFHGKFIVTDNSAIALSANLIELEELDALVIYNEKEKIMSFNEKFNYLKELFILEVSDQKGVTFEGTIKPKMTKLIPKNQNIEKYFELPKNVDMEYKQHWIRHYPIELCPLTDTIEEGLLIAPFDCQARHCIEKIIDNSSEYAYISAESFTDQDFPNFLFNMKGKGLDIKILSGYKSMDFTDRIQKMFRDLLSYDIECKTIEEEIHAKLIVTEKYLLISSVNLNKINLGFHPTKSTWRSNTETILISTNQKIIDKAETQFLNQFEKSIPIQIKLAEKMEKNITKLFKSVFELSISGEVKKLLTKYLLMREIDEKRITKRIGEITSLLMVFYNTKRVEKKHMMLSMILFFLAERKQDFNQLNEQLSSFSTDHDLKTLLSNLILSNLIEKDGDFYKINVIRLLKRKEDK